MNLEAVASTLPDHAKDLRLNLATLLKDTTLTPQQQWGTLLCCAVVSRQPRLLAAVADEAASHLSVDAIKAARAAASIMAMNNIYYRFTHVVSDRTYAAMPTRLRMQVIGKPGVAKEDFELWCLAASAIGGCSACMDSHEKTLREVGVSREVVQQAVRLAAVIHAVAVTLEAELEPAAA
jgi:alkyl hydroperoxide reductase subunit D